MTSKSVARVSAAGFALGLYLGAPGLAVAGAETGNDDSAAVSASSADQISKTTETSRKARVPGVARSSGVSQRGDAQQPAASAATTSRRADAAARRAAQPAAALPRSAASKSSQPVPHPATQSRITLTEQAEFTAAANSVVEPAASRVADRSAAKAPISPYPAVTATSAAATVSSGADSGISAARSIPGAPSAAGMDSLAALNNGVVRWFDSVTYWLSSLPANPGSDFISGALLLVRRSVFNQAPVADAVQIESTQNGFGQIRGTIKATDAEGDRLIYTLVSAPKFGTVELNAATGGYVYTPDADPETINDGFTVAASDNGFNLLAPFGDRSTEVQSFVGGNQLVGTSQGFKVVNLTNSVVWLTDIQPDYTTDASLNAWEATCRDQGFCNGATFPYVSESGGRYSTKFTTDRTGTVLLPGDSLAFDLSTDATAWLNFYAPDLAAMGTQTPTWRVQAFSRVSAGATYIRLCKSDGLNGGCGTGDAMRKFVPFSGPNNDPAIYNKMERYDWFGGSGPGVVSYAQEDSRTLFLVGSKENPTQAPFEVAPWQAGQTYNIGPNTVWTTKAPSWCPKCGDAPALDALQVFQNLLAFGGYRTIGDADVQTNPRYAKSFVPKYSNVTYDSPKDFDPTSYTTTQNGESPVRILNPNPTSGAGATYNWTVTAFPQAPPNSPWWQKYAAQGGGALAKLLVGQIPFIGAAISGAVGTAVEGALKPEEIAAPRTLTGTATVERGPWSIGVLTTSLQKYDVTGDVAFTIKNCANGSSTRCDGYEFSNGIKSGDIATFSFTGMDFQVVPKNPQYTATFNYQPYDNGAANNALTMNDFDSGSIFPRDYKIGGSYLLGVTAFKGAGRDAQAGAVFSQRGCETAESTNCTTFDVAIPSIARIEIIPGTGLANLIPLRAGTTTVTATYKWVVPLGGGLPAQNGSVRATMPFSVIP